MSYVMQLFTRLSTWLARGRVAGGVASANSVSSAIAKQIAMAYIKKAAPSLRRRLAIVKEYLGKEGLSGSMVTALGTNVLGEGAIAALDSILSDVLAFYETTDDAEVDALYDYLLDKYADPAHLREIKDKIVRDVADVDLIDVGIYAATVIGCLISIYRKRKARGNKLGSQLMKIGAINGTSLSIVEKRGKLILKDDGRGFSATLDEVASNPLFFVYAVLGSVTAYAVNDAVGDRLGLQDGSSVIDRMTYATRIINGETAAISSNDDMGPVGNYEPTQRGPRLTPTKAGRRTAQTHVVGEVEDSLSARLRLSPLDSSFIRLRDIIDNDGIIEVSEYVTENGR